MWPGSSNLLFPACDDSLFTSFTCFYFCLLFLREGVVIKHWHQLEVEGLCKMDKFNSEKEGVNFSSRPMV